MLANRKTCSESEVAYEDDKQVVEAVVHKVNWTDARVIVDVSEA